MLPVIYGFIVGVVFSTTGAGGAILAGVGHISLFGIKDANVVKTYNQILVTLSGLVSSPIYLKQRRIILILALLLSVGSFLGSLAGSQLSYNHLRDIQSYKVLFGILTLIVSTKLIYDALSSNKKGKQNLNDKVQAKIQKMRLYLTSGKFSTSFYIISPIVAGFIISFVSSALGIGGGFLILPYMIFLLKIPAYFVPGTAIISVLISSSTSFSNYIRLGVNVDTSFLALESLGMLIGSFVGPFLSKKLGERNLKIAIGLLLLYIGIGYTLGGWMKSTFGIKIL